MIKVENLSYGVPSKELYIDVCFTLETGQHCALIGSNGTGKSTLVDIIIHPDKYIYDGNILMDDDCRIGYGSQFIVRDKLQDITVFEFLSERFVKNQQDIAAACDEMTTAEDMNAAFEKYQKLLDLNESMDGDNYENNISRQLYIAKMTELKDTLLCEISGGEYKLLQIMREMLLSPNLLVLDEPDVFLDFGNLNNLCQLINNYKGTILVVTHNRYLLNHCFNKILHLENGALQEFDGSYMEYRCQLLREKLEQTIQYMSQQDEIDRTRTLVETLRRRASALDNPVIGKAVNAKQSQLERLIARSIERPFIEIREPEIHLPEVEVAEEKVIISVKDYNVVFEEALLEKVSFDLMPGEKVAIVGANGTGKTTLVRDIISGNHASIQIDKDTKYLCLSQLQADAYDENATIYRIMLDTGYGNEENMTAHLEKYCLGYLGLNQKFGQLSGGEQNLFQIALMAGSDAELLILDEPTSHLDIYAQTAFQQAISEYRGTVLMISHDFYLIAACADYVLLLENNTVWRMRSRSFRKMAYEKYFNPEYLEFDKKNQEIEATITKAYKNNDLATVEKLCNQLEAL